MKISYAQLSMLQVNHVVTLVPSSRTWIHKKMIYKAVMVFDIHKFEKKKRVGMGEVTRICIRLSISPNLVAVPHVISFSFCDMCYMHGSEVVSDKH